MRTSWTGLISFGLVNIPIGLYSATEDREVTFHLLHREDSGRIHNERTCSVCGKSIGYDDIVKGYEYKKGSYVTLTDEDFERVAVEQTQSINIVDFVDAAQIAPILSEKPYYIVPGKKAETAYILLREALKSTGKVGIAKVVLRSRERLAAIRVYGDALVLDTMHFADEVREAEGIPSSEVKVGKRELDMATMLIKAMSGEFNIDDYKDTYTDALKAAIDRKIAGKQIETPVEAPSPTNVIDIMEQLTASVERAAKPGHRKRAA